MLKLMIRFRNDASTATLPVLLSLILSPLMAEVARSQCPTPGPQCLGSLCSPNFSLPAEAIIGWDGDHDAVYANMDGSYYVRDGRCTTVSFGIYPSPTPSPQTLYWYNDNGSGSGYLPCLTTQFERDNCTIKISSFADRVTVPGNLGNDYVAIYTRVSVYNHDNQKHTLCPSPSVSPSPGPNPVALTSNSCTVAAGQTVNNDYVIAADRFDNTYCWPSDTNLAAAGGWDTHFAHMASYWNNKLAGIVNIMSLPDDGNGSATLINAYKAGYIYTHIVRDGSCLKVGEGPWYDNEVFDRDATGILTTLLTIGDFGVSLTDAQTLLANLSYANFNAATAQYVYPLPWAIYLEKIGASDGFVSSYFNSRIKPVVHSTALDRIGANHDGIMMASTGLDAVNGTGFFTTDNWSALTGFAAYKYICHILGNSSEEQWAIDEYNSLLTAVNNTLSATMTSFGINYLPPSMFDSNASRDPTDANWASMFMSGLWAWDGYLLGASQSGVSLTNIDKTYDAGFLAGQAVGLYPHNFGAFIGGAGTTRSSAYNAGFGSGALQGERYRSEGIYAYEFMINNGQSGPFCWHESFYDSPTVPGPWHGTHPRAAIVGDSPHMWGQATAAKVLIDSLIAEKIDGSVIIGRGVPNTWVANGQVQLSNFPIASNNRMGFNLQGANGRITLTLTGATPSGGAILDLRAFWNNIASVTPPIVRIIMAQEQ